MVLSPACPSGDSGGTWVLVRWPRVAQGQLKQSLPEKGSGISGGGKGTEFVAHEVWAKMLQCPRCRSMVSMVLWCPRCRSCQDHGARGSALGQKLMNGSTVSTTLAPGGLPPVLLLMLLPFFHQEHG